MAGRKGPGRPPGILKPDARRRAVTVKFNDAEYARLEAAAQAESLPIAEYIRGAIDLAYARGSTR